MKKVIISILLVVPIFGNATETKKQDLVCETKISTLENIKLLSDYEIIKSWAGLLKDPRFKSFKSPRELELWIIDQPDCDEWSPGSYTLEVKWLLHQAFQRNLFGTIQKIQNKQVRLNNGNIEEIVKERWIPWNTYRK